jgi:uncharacterized protein (DUF433 family)
VELQDIQVQLTEALQRIQKLEEHVSTEKELASWRYLVARPHRWRRQLCIKGRNMTVGQLVSTVRANRLAVEQAADEFELPPAAIEEALSYYAQNRALIELESAEERRRLAQRGYALEPKDLPR